MLNGVIMDNAGKSFKQPRSNLLSKVDMQQQNIKRIGKIAIRSGKGGTIKLHLPNKYVINMMILFNDED